MSVAVMMFMVLHQLFSIDQRPFSSVQVASMMLDSQHLNKHPVCESLLRCSCGYSRLPCLAR